MEPFGCAVGRNLRCSPSCFPFNMGTGDLCCRDLRLGNAYVGMPSTPCLLSLPKGDKDKEVTDLWRYIKPARLKNYCTNRTRERSMTVMIPACSGASYERCLACRDTS